VESKDSDNRNDCGGPSTARLWRFAQGDKGSRSERVDMALAAWVLSAILSVEWRIPNGYERCAAIVAQRDSRWLWAWTANHCVADYSAVRFFDGHVVRGGAVQVVWRSGTIDAALLRLPAAGIPRAVVPIKRAATVPALGSIVAIVGHPVAAAAAVAEGRWTVQYGRLAPPYDNPDTGAVEEQVYCPTCGPGDSGGGVFDANGYLLGMIYGVTPVQDVAGGRFPDGLYADVIPVAQLPVQRAP
jgi:hypothetical protein